MVHTSQSSNPYYRTPAIRLTSTPQSLSVVGLQPSADIIVEYICFCNHDPALASHPVTVKDGNGMFLCYIKDIAAKEPTDINLPESGVEFAQGLQVFTDAGGSGLIDCWIRCRRVQ